MLYICILLLLIFLSYKYDIKGAQANKQFWYYFVLAIFVLLAGLRYRIGGDTVEYIDRFYYIYPSLSDFSFEDYPIGRDPLYVLLNSIVKSLGGKFYVLQLILAAFVNILIFKYIKRHTPYVFTGVAFYFLGAFFIFNTEILRGAISIVICLYANDFIMGRKWLRGIILYVIASLFHVQTLVIAFTPLLFFLRFNKKGVVFLIIMFFVSVIMQKYFGVFFNKLEMVEAVSEKGAYYNEQEGFSQTGNLNFFIVGIIPYVVYILFCVRSLKRKGCYERIKHIEPYLLLGLSFYIVLINNGIANRYVDYYRVYFAILYAETYVCLIKTKSQIITKQTLIRTFIIFLPMLLLQYGYFTRIGGGVRYNPYSSVIERKIDPQREKYYSNIGLSAPRPEDY